VAGLIAIVIVVHMSAIRNAVPTGDFPELAGIRNGTDITVEVFSADQLRVESE
jgi:hypothetical protein